MFPVEIFRAALEKTVSILQQHSIRFHLTGGLTSMAYGEPRMTQDVDVVVDNGSLAANLDAFLQALESHRFLFEPASIRQAVAHHGMFQVFDMDEALKIDFYPRELIPGELERSEMLEVFTGVSLPIVSKVDAVGSKLIWISKGSHKSRRDVRHIYRRASADECQQIRQLSEQLRLQDLLDEVLNESDEIENS
jgi:hypothetical protein